MFTKVTVNNTNNGPTAKHSEYRYAKKWQTFQWKCQTASGNTRNMPGQKLIEQPVVLALAGPPASVLKRAVFYTPECQDSGAKSSI